MSEDRNSTYPHMMKEAAYFEEKRKKKERNFRIAEKLKTIVASNKDDSNGKSDFQCYIPTCKFATYNKSDYERHVVTKHQ